MVEKPHRFVEHVSGRIDVTVPHCSIFYLRPGGIHNLAELISFLLATNYSVFSPSVWCIMYN